MSDTIIVALLASIPAIISALSSFKNGNKLNNVHDLVNGGLKAAKQEIEQLKAKIELLNKEIDTYTRT